MKTFILKLYASDHIFYEGPSEHVMFPTEDGYKGILANHRNTIAAVYPGILIFRKPGSQDEEVVVTRGLVRIEENEVLILVHEADKPEDVDIKAIKRAESEFKRREKEKNSKIEFHSAEINILRAIEKLKRIN